MGNRAAIRVGDRVRVRATKQDGSPHPHAGKTGNVAHVHLGYLTGSPTAYVLLDQGQPGAGTYAVVSWGNLERIPRPVREGKHPMRRVSD